MMAIIRSTMYNTFLLWLLFRTCGMVTAFRPMDAGTVLLRPRNSCSSKSPYSNFGYQRLHAEPSKSLPADDEVVVVVNKKSSSAYDDGDPRQALEQFGSLFSQVQLIVTEGNTWDSDTLEEKTREFVTSYVRIVVPGLGFAATSMAVYLSFAAVMGLILAVSGRGYDDILSAVGGFEPLRDLLEKVDPTWGNAAIVLLMLEVLSPALVVVTLALTPKMMDVLRTNLDEWGWGEDGINDRVSEIMGKDSSAAKTLE